MHCIVLCDWQATPVTMQTSRQSWASLDSVSVSAQTSQKQECVCVCCVRVTWSLVIFLWLSGKKARTFDLEAMFEQTRRTAIERSQRALGQCGYLPVILCQRRHFNLDLLHHHRRASETGGSGEQRLSSRQRQTETVHIQVTSLFDWGWAAFSWNLNLNEKLAHYLLKSS